MAVRRGFTPNGIYYDKLGRDNLCLLWHLKEILNTLPIKHVVDIGAGVRVSKNICLPERIASAAVVDSDSSVLEALIDEYDDKRLSAVADAIQSVPSGEEESEIVYLILSLPWLDKPSKTLQIAASRMPSFIVISELCFSPEQLVKIPSCLPEHGSAIAALLEKHYARKLDIDAIMASCGYYPLVVYGSPSWNFTPEHSIKTVLYTRERPDRVPYDKAKYIIQVNGKCTNNCPSCYVVKTDETMDTALFRNLINDVGEHEVICLRGGEPPLSENLIEDFIRPALGRGIYVILESNGSFIGSARYRDYMELLTHGNIEVRLSLDREHYDFFPEHIQRTRIGWISRFIEDATRMDVKFGMYTLGMCRSQVLEFLRGFSVEWWIKYIKPLTRYSNISDLPIRGKYVDIKGTVHDSMSGEYIRRSFFSSYEEVVESGTFKLSASALPVDGKAD